MVDSRSSSLSRGMRNHSETPKAKRCPKCNRAHAKVQYWERRERGVCVECGKAPAFQGGRRCERCRDRAREYDRGRKRRRQRREPKFIDCEICGIKIRKNGNVKYCRPCSAVMAGTYERIYAERKLYGKKDSNARGFQQGRIGSFAKNARRSKSAITCESTTNGRGKDYAPMREGSSKGNQIYCEECRRDRKLKEIRRRKEG